MSGSPNPERFSKRRISVSWGDSTRSRASPSATRTRLMPWIPLASSAWRRRPRSDGFRRMSVATLTSWSQHATSWSWSSMPESSHSMAIGLLSSSPRARIGSGSVRVCTTTRAPARRRCASGTVQWRASAWACSRGDGSGTLRSSAAVVWLMTAPGMTFRWRMRAMSWSSAGAVEGVMKPGITSTNSSEARRRECTPRAVSSARLSRLRGFGDQSGGAMVRSYAAARIHISSPVRDVDDRLWGGQTAAVPRTPKPRPAPARPPAVMCIPEPPVVAQRTRPLSARGL